MKNVVVINGHPDPKSYNYALSKAYMEGAMQNNANIVPIDIAALDFDPNLSFGYRKRMELEPDLVDAWNKIKEADHLVWFFPMWWYGMPALMKGFIDRVFLPGLTFQPIPGKPLPQKLLKGKTARVVLTSDTPAWYDYFYMKRPLINQFKKGVLQFCGVSPVKVTYIAPIKNATEQFRKKWLDRMLQLGRELK